MSTLSPAQPETAQSEQSVLERIQSLESQYLLQNYARYPLVLSRGKGCYAYDAAGKRYLDFIAGIGELTKDRAWTSFGLTETDPDGAKVRRPARGMEERLPGGELVFVGADVGEAQGYVVKIVNALWGAAALVIVLGLAGGVLVARDVSRNMAGLTDVINAALNSPARQLVARWSRRTSSSRSPISADIRTRSEISPW